MPVRVWLRAPEQDEVLACLSAAAGTTPMGPLYSTLRDIKNSTPILLEVYGWLRHVIITVARRRNESYAARLSTETDIFKDAVDLQALPPIYGYWSNKYLRPMVEEYGFSNSDQ